MVLTVLLALTALAELSTASVNDSERSLDRKEFFDPPISARPGAYWPWLNGSVSLERITYELEEMKAKGMGWADIWDVASIINPGTMIPVGPEFLGKESLKAIGHAVKEADRLGLRLGMIAASGWNAGGPWVKPADAGMGLLHSQVSVEGPARFSDVLPFPEVSTLCPRDVNGSPVYWKEIAVLAVPQNADLQIPSASAVIDLSEYLDKESRLVWNVPAGKWTIMRFVMTNTGYPLVVPSPKSRGPMIDFLDPDASRMHFEHVVEKLQSELGDIADSPLKYLEVDSLELGHDTIWTEEIVGKFKERYGYGPLPYLPLLRGWKFEDADVQERFLYDWKKHISDLLIESHYRAGSKVLNEYGLMLCAEGGGPGAPIWPTCPVDSLKALGAVDIPRGEFWPKMRNIWLVKEISSAAHIYGKRIVDAESFTSWRHWLDGPYFYKHLADTAMGEGLNHFTFCSFTHSPKEAGLPGFVIHAGTHINPNVVWWPMARPFMDYISRCCYLLQKGLFVADVCYYYGDKAPNFVSPKHVGFTPGPGYDYDVINSDVLLNRMTVKNGRILLPDGMSYALLVLPEQEDMDLEVLRKLESLIKAGATVIGAKPTRTGTLVDYPNRDRQVARLAEKIWGDCDGEKVKERAYGKGRVFWNRSVREVLRQREIGRDFSYKGRDGRSRLDYIHRRTEEEDIYFVINMNERWEEVECTFRIAGKQPELWHPETGTIRNIIVYETKGGFTHVPLHLKPAESVFVVFRKPLDRVRFMRLESMAAKTSEDKPVLFAHSATPGGPMWLSDGKGKIAEQYIAFDLGKVRSLTNIRIWNYMERARGFMNYGIKEMEVLGSSDGANYRKCGSFPVHGADAAGNEDKHYYQDIPVAIENVRYIRFDAKTNYDNYGWCDGISKYVGISKVKFFGPKEISGVRIHAVSSGAAFDPASDEDLGVAHLPAELLTDDKNMHYLRVWKPGSYSVRDNAGRTKKVELKSVKRPLEVTGPWHVEFPPGWGAPAHTTFERLISWTDSDDNGIRYFSGRAVYRKEFNIPGSYLNPNSYVELDLGAVQKVARVSLNGREIAILWKPPFCADITDAARPGKNELVVEVGNNWTNRLVGDTYLPPEKRFCKSNLQGHAARKEQRLQPSGLMGPVHVHKATKVDLWSTAAH